MDRLCDELNKSKLQERDQIVTSLMSTVPADETDEHFKWRLEFNARVVTALRDRRIWPVKRWECPWEEEHGSEPDQESSE